SAIGSSTKGRPNAVPYGQFLALSSYAWFAPRTGRECRGSVVACRLHFDRTHPRHGHFDCGGVHDGADALEVLPRPDTRFRSAAFARADAAWSEPGDFRGTSDGSLD